MKKLLLSVAVVAASANLFAQGTWKATGTEAAIAASTECGFGISSLTVMHSDGATVIGKADNHSQTGAAITYNGITYDNKGILQGATNGMYFAFQPTKNGTLDIASKIGSAKITYVMEVTGATSLADLTTNNAANADVKGNAALTIAYPIVTSSLDNTTSTWDGTAAINNTGANIYTVLSFNVTANKIYVVGVDGSKYMLRGVTLTASGTTGINSAPSLGTIVSSEYYSLTGVLVGTKYADLKPGIYLQKSTFDTGKATTVKISKTRP